MNWYLDVFAEDYNDTNSQALMTIQRLQEQDRSLPCEDDCELSAPFIGILPEESDQEEPSPLDFGGARRYGPSGKTHGEVFR